MGGRGLEKERNTVKRDLESNCITSLFFYLPFYFRYVDDIKAAVPHNKIDTIKNTFNNYNYKIQFTREEESEGRISFLDGLKIKVRDGIKTNWYHKPTWSGYCLNFNLNHPYKYKINVFNNLVDRCISLSHNDFHKANIKKIKSILHKHNYPSSMINSCINKRLNHLSLKTTGTNTKSYQPLGTTQPNLAEGQCTTTKTRASPKYMSLPYVQSLSEKLSGILKPFDINIAPRNVNNLSHFFKPTKDRISKLDTADVVYNILYTDCTATYIGTFRNHSQI